SEDPEPEPEPEVDKTDLEAAVSEAETLNEDDYTEDSFEALSSALQEAESVLADEDATEEDVATALATLQEAMDDLEESEDPEPEPEPEVDKTDLEAAVSEAESL